MSARLLQLEKDLRGALARRAYIEVQKIAAEFSAQAAAEWCAFPSGTPRARRIFDRWRNVLEWTRVMVCTSRASQADELRRMLLTNRYLAGGGATGNHLHFDI